LSRAPTEVNHREKTRKSITKHIAREEVVKNQQRHTTTKQKQWCEKNERPSFLDSKRPPLQTAKDVCGKVDQQPESQISKCRERPNQ